MEPLGGPVQLHVGMTHHQTRLIFRTAFIEIHFRPSAGPHATVIRPGDIDAEPALVGRHVELVVIIVHILRRNPLGEVAILDSRIIIGGIELQITVYLDIQARPDRHFCLICRRPRDGCFKLFHLIFKLLHSLLQIGIFLGQIALARRDGPPGRSHNQHRTEQIDYLSHGILLFS